MKLIEYRIFMPLTLEENLIGQIWSFSEISRENTGGGEGVEILENRLFELPLDKEGRVVYKQLPEFEDYETQKSNSKSSMRKSSSKDNFTSIRPDSSNNKARLLTQSESVEITLNSMKPKKASQSTTGSTNEAAESTLPKSLSESNSLSSQSSEQSSTVDSETEAQQSRESNEMAASSNPTFDVQHAHNKYGQYTHKLYMIASKVPWFVRKLLPRDSTIIHEKSWNMYPVVKTVLYNEYFRNCSRIELDTITRVCPDGKCEENVHNLTSEQLSKREVVNINIAELLSGMTYRADEDPAIFKSKKTGRGPLDKDTWIGKTQPLICCYKLVFAEFKVFGLQTRSENYLVGMYKQLFAVFHRQIFCWIDKWYDLSLEEVRKIEFDLAQLLLKKIDEGELSKNQLSSGD